MATIGNNAIHSHDIMSSEDDRPRRARIYSDVTDLATLPGHEKAVRHRLADHKKSNSIFQVAQTGSSTEID